MKDKVQIRRRIKARLASVHGEERRIAAEAAGGYLVQDSAWRDSLSLVIFMAMATEIDTEAVVKVALDEGKTVYIPRVVGSHLEFRAISSLDDSFESAPFGIRQPRPSASKWNPRSSPEPGLIIVPGVAFDPLGNRLGRGGGFYDRFIEGIRCDAASFGKRPPLCLGFAYEQQLVDELPVEAHDQLLDGLVTEVGLRKFRRREEKAPAPCL